jgi:hypothetical protein
MVILNSDLGLFGNYKLSIYFLTFFLQGKTSSYRDIKEAGVKMVRYVSKLGEMDE